MVNFPTHPSRKLFYEYGGGVIEGFLGFGLVVEQGSPTGVVGEYDKMTLTEDLRLRVQGAGGGGLITALGSSGVKFSPVYFTAAYHDADELQLSGLPDLPANVQWIGVIEWTATDYIPYLQPQYHLTYNAATGRLQVAGVTFGAGSEFMAIYVTEQNAYDQVLNALQVVRLDAHQWDWIDEQEPIDAVTLDDDPTNTDTDWINVKGFTIVRLWLTWTTGWENATGPNTLHIRRLENPTDAGTVEYQATNYVETTYIDTLYGEIKNLEPDNGMGAAVTPTLPTAYHRELWVDVDGYDRVKFQFWETLGQGGTAVNGTLSVSTTIINSSTNK